MFKLEIIFSLDSYLFT